MKRQISCVALAARCSLLPVLGGLGAMAAAQIAIFLLQMNGADGAPALEAILDHWGFRMTARAALVCAAAAVGRPWGWSGAALRCTVERLPVSRRRLTAWWAVYGVGCFALCWAAQLAAAFGLGRWYEARVLPEAAQALFLASYRSGYLHTLLPLADTAGWAATGMLYFGLGLASAGSAAAGWQGRTNVAPLIVAAVTFFGGDALHGSGWNVMLGIASLVIGAVSLWSSGREETP